MSSQYEFWTISLTESEGFRLHGHSFSSGPNVEESRCRADFFEKGRLSIPTVATAKAAARAEMNHPREMRAILFDVCVKGGVRMSSPL
jgi:hypothetical protein